MEYILSLSYGKDSLACLGAIEQMGWPLDRIEWCTVAYNNAFGERTKRSQMTQIKNAPLLGKTKSVKCIETQKNLREHKTS